MIIHNMNLIYLADFCYYRKSQFEIVEITDKFNVFSVYRANCFIEFGKYMTIRYKRKM